MPFNRFAAAAVVRAPVLADLLRSIHNLGQTPNRLAVPLTAHVDGVAWPLDLDLFVEAFQPRLIAGRRPQLTLDFVGTVTATPPGQPAQVRRIAVRTAFDVVPAVLPTPDGMSLRFSLGVTRTEVEGMQVLSGPAMPAGVHRVFERDGAFVFVVNTIRAGLAMVPASPPFLSQIATLTRDFGLVITDTPVRVFDDAIAIGVNARTVTGLFDVGTAGTVDDLEDFGTGDLTAWLRPDFIVPLVRAALLPGGADYLDLDHGATRLSDLALTLEFDALRVRGTATRRARTVSASTSFSVRIQPDLTRTGVVFRISDVDVATPWWAHLISVLLGPIGVAIEAAIGGALQGVVRQLEGSAAFEFGRTQTVHLPIEAGAMRFALRIDSAEIGARGLQVSADFAADWEWPLGDRPSQLSRSSLGPVTVGLTDVSYRVLSQPSGPPLTISSSFRYDDPSVRVRWEVHRLDDRALVVEQDLPITDPAARGIRFNPASPELFACPGYRIYRRVYRNGGGGPEELSTRRFALDVVSGISTAHPYVRWDHEVYVPWVQIVTEMDDPRRIVTRPLVQRHSKIHRTALRGRCQMVDRHSRGVREVASTNWRLAHIPVLQYLDELPFPVEELADYRHELCHYCFFGGPDKLVPLPLP